MDSRFKCIGDCVGKGRVRSLVGLRCSYRVQPFLGFRDNRYHQIESFYCQFNGFRQRRYDSIDSKLCFLINNVYAKGYHLWIATKSTKSDSTQENGNSFSFNGVSKLSMTKSVIASNPSSSINEELVLLTSEDRLFIGIGAVNVGQQQYSNDCNDSSSNGSIFDDITPSTNCSTGKTFKCFWIDFLKQFDFRWNTLGTTADSRR